MAKKFRFPLEMENGVEVRSIEELKENFSLAKILIYLSNGKLLTWLRDRYIDDIANEVEKLDCSDPNLAKKISDIFNVEYDEQNQKKLEEAKEINNKISILKTFTLDKSFINVVDSIAFTQDDLYDLLDEGKNIIYLCGDSFSIPINKKNMNYIGINNPVVVIDSKEIIDWKERNIKFTDVTFDNKYQKIIEFFEIIKSREKSNEVNNNNYCKTFVKDGWGSCIVVDEKGIVYTFGIIANGQGHIPRFQAPIIDIDASMSYVVSLDKNGKVYQWGSLPYKCPSVPSDLPKIKQVVADTNIIIVLDELGKLHWWGGFDSAKIFYGNTNYGGVDYLSMPEISSKIVQVDCNANVVIALDEDGKIHTWGYCGNEKFRKVPIHNLPKNLPFIKKVTIFRGGDFAFALDEYGKIHFWGNDSYGSSNIPKDLPFIVDISKFNSDVYSALDKNGRIHIWGERAEPYYDRVKKLPVIKSLVDIGGIDENGYIHDLHRSIYPLFSGKVLLPNN
ncbi:hypothetical protein [Acetoanaerobium noterae]|uniref:hypothetical protein n=1 Tax=Acetoanaerobium noterae TaxID=745369 RepID=UPI0033209A7A